jgi:UDP-N-acetylmuramyl pentapeptide synthase
MKAYVQKKLAGYAEAVLHKYHPLVIGITGSVGKTSAKEAVFAALSSRPGVATNPKNFNNEFGTPLSVLQVKTAPGRNPGAWASIFLSARNLIHQHVAYPKILVLELGIDHPGDMDYLADMVRPNIAVITAIGTAHIEYFGSIERIAQEKTKILKHVGTTGTAILNYEDERLRELLPQLTCKTLTYGFNSAADIKAGLVNVEQKEGKWGTAFTIEHGKEHAELFLANLVGSAHVLACLAGVSVAIAVGLAFDEAVENVKGYNPQPGRMRLIPGLSGSVIIDDSYNSSPQATLLAIDELSKFPAERKIAILGDMRELGSAAEYEHRALAAPLAKSSIRDIVLVGNETRALALELVAIGYPTEHLAHFKNSYEAASDIQRLAAPDTVFLVKGSQNIIRMERVVEALMRDPKQASRLLVRQDASWLRKK